MCAFGSSKCVECDKFFGSRQVMTDKSSDKRAVQIDENLKRVYQEALQEELPDRFMDLLNQLKAKDSNTTEGGAE